MSKVIADIYGIYKDENGVCTKEEQVEGQLVSIKGGDGPGRPWILKVQIKGRPELNGRYIFGCSRPVGEVTNFAYHPNQEYFLLRNYEDKNWLVVKAMHRKNK